MLSIKLDLLDSDIYLKAPYLRQVVDQRLEEN